jgi:hypothetical protein
MAIQREIKVITRVQLLSFSIFNDLPGIYQFLNSLLSIWWGLCAQG